MKTQLSAKLSIGLSRLTTAIILLSFLLEPQLAGQAGPSSSRLPELNAAAVQKKGLHVVLTPKGWGAQISPSRQRIVFACAASGFNEVWISNVDGSHPMKVTSLEGPIAGTPRWSPDGKWIAFDVNGLTHGAVFVVSAEGGKAHEIAADASENSVPSWSRDGRWVYFASDRTGEWQVWKVPLDKGDAVQVTKSGGFAALESLDGQYVYFSKTRYPNSLVWRVAKEGGNEEVISQKLRPDSWASWAPVPDGIYFVQTDRSGKSALMHYDSQSEAVQGIADLRYRSFYLSAADDGLTTVAESPEVDFPLSTEGSNK